MLLPVNRIKNQAELGTAVDRLLAHIANTEDNPRKRRDLVFSVATLTRLANLGLALTATGAEGEKAAGAVADVYVGIMSAEAAKALGYEQTK